MNHLARIPSKLLTAAALTASLGLVLPALAAGSPTYTPSSSKTSMTNPGGANVTSDADITRQVKSRLSSMNNLQDSSINVSTMEGKVTLTGSVTSKDEEKSAKAAAEAIPGVKKVDDDLSVSSKPPKAGH
jgi:hyperosmotically inducible protein